MYPEYIDPEWISRPVMDVIKGALLVVHPAPRLGAPGEVTVADDVAPRAVEKGRRGESRSRAEELTALFAERRPAGDRGDARGRRRAAARARGRHGHVRRQPEHQRLEHLHRRVRVLRLRPVAALARRVRALRGGVRATGQRGGRVRRHRDLHAVGDPSRLGPRGLREVAAVRQAARAGHPPPRVLADGGRAHVRRQRPARHARCSSGCARPGSTRRRAPPPRCSTTACASGSRPNKLPGRPLGRDHRGLAHAGTPLDRRP